MIEDDALLTLRPLTLEEKTLVENCVRKIKRTLFWSRANWIAGNVICFLVTALIFIAPLGLLVAALIFVGMQIDGLPCAQKVPSARPAVTVLLPGRGH